MKSKYFFILFLIILLFILNFQEIKAYNVSVKSEIANKIIKNLPENWQYAFNVYMTEIRAGIVEVRDTELNLFYNPINNTGNLINKATEAYSNFVTELNKPNIKKASNYLGKFISYVVDLSNPFRLGKSKNKTLALNFEALSKSEDVEKISINKNYKIKNLNEELKILANFSLNKAQELNITKLNEGKRDSKLENVYESLLEKVIAIIYTSVLNAIKEHKEYSLVTNIIYITVILGIISLFLVYLNKDKIKIRINKLKYKK